MLFFQILNLVCILIESGHFGNKDNVKTLLGPLLDLLDGRNDIPYQTAGYTFYL